MYEYFVIDFKRKSESKWNKLQQDLYLRFILNRNSDKCFAIPLRYYNAIRNRFLQQLIFEEKPSQMTFINLREFSKLIQISQPIENLRSAIKLYHQKYNISVLLEDFQSLIDLAQKVNKRERSKTQKHSRGLTLQKNQIFVYGEFKLFSWTLVLYCLINSVQLGQMKLKDFLYISQIFKQKSLDFIEYEVKCLEFSKDKYTREWEEQEVQLLQAINKERTNQDWKSVAFDLFCRSSKKYFRPFQQCREKWINYINPSVKKGDWTLQEDIQLFELVNQYGCRWALISRQLKGTRSEHSIKNRYNSVIKNMRRQYKITSTQQVESKVLKYLKFRSDRKVKNQQSLDISLESKESRERSREMPVQRVSNQSQFSNTSQHVIFDDVFNVQLQFKEEEEDVHQDVNAKPSVYCEELEQEKKEKRTWEEQYEVKDGQISIGNCNGWCEGQIKIENREFEAIVDLARNPSYLLDNQFNTSQEMMPSNIREDIQEALGCGHYEKLMNDDWLFEGNWLDLDE